METDRRGVWVNFVNWNRAVRHAAAGALLAGERLGQACMRLWIKVKQGEREKREGGGGGGGGGGLAQCLCLGSGCTHHALLALT